MGGAVLPRRVVGVRCNISVVFGGVRKRCTPRASSLDQEGNFLLCVANQVRDIY